MDLREALAAGLEAAESQPESTPVATEQPSEGRARDDAGRFVAKEPKEEPKVEVKPEGVQPNQVVPPPVEPQIQRPSTWKKEYWPLYDKLATGQGLTPEEAKKLADYSNQRENEFKSGVSTYKAEAENAKSLQAAIAPFVPELQKYGIDPGQWISNLGRAHQTLALGSPQEKLMMFQRLAQEYGVDLSQIGQAPQLDPNVQYLQNELRQIQQQFSGFMSAQQQAEQVRIQQEINSFGASHPHFEAVKAQMAQLLESGMAQNLQSAYDQACRLNDDVWSQIQQQKTAQQSQQAAVAAAKAAAVSPKSASPSATNTPTPKGLRAHLEAGLEAALGGGRV